HDRPPPPGRRRQACSSCSQGSGALDHGQLACGERRCWPVDVRHGSLVGRRLFRLLPLLTMEEQAPDATVTHYEQYSASAPEWCVACEPRVKPGTLPEALCHPVLGSMGSPSTRSCSYSPSAAGSVTNHCADTYPSRQ